MQAVGPTQLIVLLVAVAITAAACGFLGSVVVRRRKRRARGVFVLGFLCGVTAGALLRTRRHIRHALGRGVRSRTVETRGDAYRLAARTLALAVTAGRDATPFVNRQPARHRSRLAGRP
ncbi:MAG: hypothetical protein QOE30_3822 [Mycobacterium sp.]|jgi:hypothetical protein|nr:hypothetical protein [Mycobacterium sp.]